MCISWYLVDIGTGTKESNVRMQLSTVFVFAMVLISLLFSCLQALPVFVESDDKVSLDDLREMKTGLSRQHKRICGMSLICRPYKQGKSGKRNQIQPPFQTLEHFDNASQRRGNNELYLSSGETRL